MKRPTGPLSFAKIVIKTARRIDAKIQGCCSQGGWAPIKILRKVPPLIDATAAISNIPP
jgi:hypothetical protein